MGLVRQAVGLRFPAGGFTLFGASMLVVLSILFWFIGFNAIETFFTGCGRFHLDIEE